MAISFIAGIAQFSSSNVTSGSLNVTAGDTLFVQIRFQTDDIDTVTDTAGNVYRLASTFRMVGGTLSSVWYCTNCAAHATNVITVTTWGGTCSALAVVQFRGLATKSPLDVNVRTVLLADPIISPAFTTIIANSAIIVFCDIETTTSTWSVGTGYTLAVTDGSNVQFIEYKIVSSIQTGVTASANSNNGSTIRSMIVLAVHEEIASGGGGEQSHVF